MEVIKPMVEATACEGLLVGGESRPDVGRNDIARQLSKDAQTGIYNRPTHMLSYPLSSRTH